MASPLGTPPISRTNQAASSFAVALHPFIPTATQWSQPNRGSHATHEIRQFSTAIDYNSYCARPISLLRPTHRGSAVAASLKTILVVAATVAAIIFVASASTHRLRSCAPTKLSLLVN
jgi:hypothetical protein